MSIKDLDKKDIDSIMSAIGSIFKAIVDVAVCYANLRETEVPKEKIDVKHSEI